MWMLVLIVISSPGAEPQALNMGQFDSIHHCFDEREMLWEYKLPDDRNGYQAICVRNEDYNETK